MEKTPTKLDYFENMSKLNSEASIISSFKGDDGRLALILDRTVFHPQGGGQPADTGFITVNGDSELKFVVQDVRSKDGIVFHYGVFENFALDSESKLEKGKKVVLYVDESRRKLNSRLHSAGHLLDVCMQNVGLGHLEPGKGYHFPDGPFVEYKGTLPQNELQIKQKELELEVNKLISRRGKVSIAVVPYKEAADMCGGSLPDYISKLVWIWYKNKSWYLKSGLRKGSQRCFTMLDRKPDIMHIEAVIVQGEIMIKPEGELKVSFGYQCYGNRGSPNELSGGYEFVPGGIQRTGSFSCLSGAAISANATLANTNICNGLIGEEILPSLDSPNSFRKVSSSPSLSRLDMLSSSLPNSMSNLSCSPSTPTELHDYDSNPFSSMSAPSRNEGFLNPMEVQVAGGAAGEDRVQAVCSEENGWLFCAIYDGFNGRDAADFLAGTLYDTIIFHFSSLDWVQNQKFIEASDCPDLDGSSHYVPGDSNFVNKDSRSDISKSRTYPELQKSPESFRQEVLDSLQRALNQAESDFLYMVEQEMEDRPDLVSIGSCVLIVFLHGEDLYTLNLGDSRAVLATDCKDDDLNGSMKLKAIQLTESHTVDEEDERNRVLCEHPDDPMTVVGGKVKGKLKVTRAFGVGYLKKKILNDALMGILRVQNLMSPPYVSTQPSLNVHRISKSDQFVIIGSDGLFDFFSNDEAVELVRYYIARNPYGDPAKFLVEQLVIKAANRAGFSMEELMDIPAGRRRKYHDDVTVMVINLGSNQRTTKASTCI
ncbi:hypothetical protein G4B88_018275 [Cannabis sativa]|uniref:PPM-type phosphatase domain-containing protein n=1 Tax=Cannabis sativa TaxID=3483 RepID=A0A7J6F354_CANSA|nr:hypothetical protein G4B88_018275 [Cannabis sativa]